jgi:sugar phosphate isomerase/epimerase
MYFTGFADEAAADLDGQIRATRELGWSNIESRNIDGINIHDLSDEAFDVVCKKLEEAGIQINCFGSTVANWSKDVRNPDDVASSRESLLRAIPRMRRLGCSMIRGMSFKQVLDGRPDTDEIRRLVVKHLTDFVKICEDEGVLYLHENCMNFGGLSPDHTMYLLDSIQSPALKLVFDTANAANTWDYREYPPTKKQDSLDFFRTVREFVHYVHIKDSVYQGENGTLFADTKYVWPGDGEGHVREIVGELIASGYEGGLSIEPHMGAVYHDSAATTDEEARYAMYVEYGRRLMKLVEEVQAATP